MSPDTHTAAHKRPGAPGSNRITEIQKTGSAVEFFDPKLEHPEYVCLMEDILDWESHPQYTGVGGAGVLSVVIDGKQHHTRNGAVASAFWVYFGGVLVFRVRL